MSQYHITRIASVLDQHFGGLISMDDWKRRPEKEIRTAFLSRALAALCVKALAGVNEETAANAVVDGYEDGGIDAILFDQLNDTFYFAQSKWSEDGTNPLTAGDSGKFADGVREILSGKIEGFNEKVKKKEPEILAALTATRLVKVVLITAHTALQEISVHGRRKIDDLIEELNIPSYPEQGGGTSESGQSVWAYYVVHEATKN